MIPAYFAFVEKSNDSHPTSYPYVPKNSFQQAVVGMHDNQLAGQYKNYKLKARKNKTAGVILGILSSVTMAAGSALMMSEDDDAVQRGTIIVAVGSFGFGSLTLISLIKNAQNGNKAKFILEENMRRGLSPLSLRLSPQYNIRSKSAALAVQISF